MTHAQRSRAKQCALVLPLILSPLACEAPRMAVPPDLASVAEQLPIADRSSMSGALVDESFKLGPYKVATVNRKWNSTTSNSLGPYSSADTAGGYTFALQTPSGGPEYKAECASRKASNEVSVLGGALGQQNYEILCHCAGPGQASFSMKAGTMSKFGGTLQTSQASFALTGVYTNDKGGSVSDPLGYEVRGDALLGAVETSGKGRAWVSRALTGAARDEVACIFAGLLLYKAPQQAFEK